MEIFIDNNVQLFLGVVGDSDVGQIQFVSKLLINKDSLNSIPFLLFHGVVIDLLSILNDLDLSYCCETSSYANNR